MLTPNRLIFSLICIVFFIAFFISISLGAVPIHLHDIWSAHSINATIFWDLRLPRTLSALTVGGLLALSGVMMQLLLQNPLADPYVLGISSGAAFISLLLLALGYSEIAFLLGAWLGSLSTMAILLLFATWHHFETQALLLLGVALAAIYTALISFLLLLTNNATLHSLLFWLTGDLNNATYPLLGLSILSIGFIILIKFSRGFNLLLRGEQEALTLGLATKRYKSLLFILSALFTATAVSIAGCLGFIGLIIPHMARRLIGTDHYKLIPMAFLLGASLLMFADTLARTLLSPQQLPVGIFLTMVGAPLFIWLLQACRT